MRFARRVGETSTFGWMGGLALNLVFSRWASLPSGSGLVALTVLLAILLHVASSSRPYTLFHSFDRLLDKTSGLPTSPSLSLVAFEPPKPEDPDGPSHSFLAALSSLGSLLWPFSSSSSSSWGRKVKSRGHGFHNDESEDDDVQHALVLTVWDPPVWGLTILLVCSPLHVLLHIAIASIERNAYVQLVLYCVLMGITGAGLLLLRAVDAYVGDLEIMWGQAIREEQRFADKLAPAWSMDATTQTTTTPATTATSAGSSNVYSPNVYQFSPNNVYQGGSSPVGGVSDPYRSPAPSNPFQRY